MNVPEVEEILKSIKIIVDTREQKTEQAERRWEAFGIPIVRKKLNFGDYSAVCTLKNGEEISLENKFCIERKMDAEEIANCLGNARDRFFREFERAKAEQGKIVLLVENCSYERILSHQYRSQLHPNSFIAGLITLMTRYDCSVMFCQAISTPILISKLLKAKMKEELLKKEDEF